MQHDTKLLLDLVISQLTEEKRVHSTFSGSTCIMIIVVIACVTLVTLASQEMQFCEERVKVLFAGGCVAMCLTVFYLIRAVSADNTCAKIPENYTQLVAQDGDTCVEELIESLEQATQTLRESNREHGTCMYRGQLAGVAAILLCSAGYVATKM